MRKTELLDEPDSSGIVGKEAYGGTTSAGREARRLLEGRAASPRPEFEISERSSPHSELEGALSLDPAAVRDRDDPV
jgi:hypothetical protein